MTSFHDIIPEKAFCQVKIPLYFALYQIYSLTIP